MVSDAWRQMRILSLYGIEGDDVTSEVVDMKDFENEVDKRYQLLEIPITLEVLRSDERFHSLRSRMSQEAIRQLENSDRPNNVRGRMPKVLKTVSNEIDRIESSWGLTENE